MNSICSVCHRPRDDHETRFGPSCQFEMCLGVEICGEKKRHRKKRNESLTCFSKASENDKARGFADSLQTNSLEPLTVFPSLEDAKRKLTLFQKIIGDTVDETDGSEETIVDLLSILVRLAVLHANNVLKTAEFEASFSVAREKSLHFDLYDEELGTRYINGKVEIVVMFRGGVHDDMTQIALVVEVKTPSTFSDSSSKYQAILEAAAAEQRNRLHFARIVAEWHNLEDVEGTGRIGLAHSLDDGANEGLANRMLGHVILTDGQKYQEFMVDNSILSLSDTPIDAGSETILSVISSRLRHIAANHLEPYLGFEEANIKTLTEM
jgi:hypothetical protein